MLSASMEAIVLDALQNLVTVEHADAAVLAAELDPVLRRITEPARVADALRFDTLAFVVRARPWSEGSDKLLTGWDTLTRAPSWFEELHGCELVATRDGLPHPDSIHVRSETDVRVLQRSSADTFVLQCRRAQLARLALRAAASRAEHGSWPDSLAALAPDVLATPAHQGAFAYVIEGREARLLADVGPRNGPSEVWTLD
jgi:hypothetical protein